NENNELSLWPQPGFSIAAEAERPEQEGVVIAHRPEESPISGTVLFPFTRAQRNGLEDLRLVRFEEEGGASFTYFGTYTAYSGAGIGLGIAADRHLQRVQAFADEWQRVGQ